jgi:hypothetical protein
MTGLAAAQAVFAALFGAALIIMGPIQLAPTALVPTLAALSAGSKKFRWGSWLLSVANAGITVIWASFAWSAAHQVGSPAFIVWAIVTLAAASVVIALVHLWLLWRSNT